MKEKALTSWIEAGIIPYILIIQMEGELVFTTLMPKSMGETKLGHSYPSASEGISAGEKAFQSHFFDRYLHLGK